MPPTHRRRIPHLRCTSKIYTNLSKYWLFQSQGTMRSTSASPHTFSRTHIHIDAKPNQTADASPYQSRLIYCAAKLEDRSRSSGHQSNTIGRESSKINTNRSSDQAITPLPYSAGRPLPRRTPTNQQGARPTEYAPASCCRLKRSAECAGNPSTGARHH